MIRFGTCVALIVPAFMCTFLFMSSTSNAILLAIFSSGRKVFARMWDMLSFHLKKTPHDVHMGSLPHFIYVTAQITLTDNDLCLVNNIT